MGPRRQIDQPELVVKVLIRVARQGNCMNANVVDPLE